MQRARDGDKFGPSRARAEKTVVSRVRTKARFVFEIAVKYASRLSSATPCAIAWVAIKRSPRAEAWCHERGRNASETDGRTRLRQGATQKQGGQAFPPSYWSRTMTAAFKKASAARPQSRQLGI